MALWLGVLAAGLGGRVAAAPVFKEDGATVEVDSERYWVRIEGLTITGIRNKLTGETYAEAADPSGAATRAGDAGVAIESLRPGLPTRVYGIGPRTQVAREKTADGVILSFSGLHAGEVFDAGLSVRLGIRVEAATGDLLLEPAARADIEEVHGCRDRGLLHAAVRVGALDPALRLVIPASDGFAVTQDNVAADWTYRARWPQFWEAALLVAESAKGSLGLWADEPELRYGRTLGIARGQGWNATLAFETSDRIERCAEVKGAVWRFNVFAGNWLQPAARYREQAAKQWPDLRPLKGGAPAWADRIRIFITGPTPDPATAARFAALVPRDTLAVFTCQEWLRGWNEGDIAKLNKGMDYFPNWPLDNPTHYEARPDMPAKFKALEEMGIHIFPYTNPTIVTWQHPWIQKLGDRHMFAYRIWQRLHPELCRDVVGRYGVSGIYEDCSWVVSRHSQGEPEGFNWYNGSAAMRQYFRELLPEVAVCGERNNEVTWRGQQFALSITQWPQHAHPIVTYLCSPYLRMWNLQLQPAGFDADDIRGWITPWPYAFEENPMQERRILRERGIVFAREQLESVWPEKWDPDVLHYFRAANGDEYRFVRERGTRFVKMTAQGPETVYWRLGGVAEAAVGTMGIEGWIGYDGERAVGLNPKAVYPVFDGVKRGPVTVSGVPAGYYLRPCAVRDGFWIAQLVGEDAGAAPTEAVLRVRAEGVELRGLCNARSVKRVSEHEIEATVELPGALGAYWAEPVLLNDTDRLTTYPVVNGVHRRDTGLASRPVEAVGGGEALAQSCGSVENGEEGSLAWLVTVPEFNLAGEDQIFLQFSYGSQHPYGDGANYSVRVNGRTVWKRYRPEQGKTDPKNPAAPQPLPLDRGQASLREYAGKVVVLELVADGNRSSVSESIHWHSPRLSTTPDHTAKTDDAEGGGVPEQPEAPLLEP
ncbi:MAG: hypothetical protein BWZ02_00003 [Lentisphaerae bacterium ADurb.BinA184]|nr:MAG: hypothetical protein BWZ02_00003 [Lentisphaerae bacterium ADurb.BinA184]